MRAYLNAMCEGPCYSNEVLSVSLSVSSHGFLRLRYTQSFIFPLGRFSVDPEKCEHRLLSWDIELRIPSAGTRGCLRSLAFMKERKGGIVDGLIHQERPIAKEANR